MQTEKALQKILDRFEDGYSAYIGVGEGWYPLLFELDERLSEIDPDYRIAQIKEKFGGLRYYIESKRYDKAQEIVDEIEDRSYTICEITGKPGRPTRKNGWIKTLSYEDFPDLEPVRDVEI
jgi:hypothetical protein